MSTTTRSAERTEFLGDLIIGAVEGGTGYWAQVSLYQHESCTPRAILHEVNDDETGYKEEGLELTIDKIASALGKISRGEIQINEGLRKHIAQASRENEAGDLDAGDCDVIAQVALLGEITYG